MCSALFSPSAQLFLNNTSFKLCPTINTELFCFAFAIALIIHSVRARSTDRIIHSTIFFDIFCHKEGLFFYDRNFLCCAVFKGLIKNYFPLTWYTCTQPRAKKEVSNFFFSSLVFRIVVQGMSGQDSLCKKK